MTDKAEKLETAWIRWLKLFDELLRRPNVNPDRVAAPFVSVAPPNYNPALIPSVLYVGKATGGDWHRERYKRSPSVSDRRKCTAEWLESVKAKDYCSPFWQFALGLSSRLGAKAKHRIEPLQNMVYTNICKIGVLDGNPSGECFAAQRDLAIETLRLEIEEYLPSLVVFVTWGYADDLIMEVIREDPNGSSWHKERNGEWLWWRESVDSMPPLLLTGHPQGKRRQDREAWLQQAFELLPPFERFCGSW